MPFLKIHTQFVWISSNEISVPTIKEVRKIVWNHIKTNAHKNGIHVDFINGYSDYYHCLIALKAHETLEKVMETLKGEKTFRIHNKRGSTESFPAEIPPFPGQAKSNNFEWKDNYFVIAVSEPAFERISNYTRNQLDEKDENLFDKENDEYYIRYGFQKFVEK